MNKKTISVVAAVIRDGERVFATQRGYGEFKDGWEFPGGKIEPGETAEEALVREIREELGVSLKISRPLWLNQSFFTKDTDGLRYHEICIYFLMDTADTGLLERQNTFTRTEGTDTHIFKWLEIAQLKDETVYPLFLKKEISNLPDGFTIRTEVR